MKVNLVNENFTDNYLENLLTARGVTNIEEYIHPTESCLESPSWLDNIDKGVTWLE